jgi:cyclopropane-fatty-acyl-phospholipid synthase
MLDGLVRKILMGRLANLRGGEILLEEGARSTGYGQATDLTTTVRVNQERFYRDAVFGGTLSVAESYLRGDWDCDDLTALFRIFVRNR